MRIADLTPRVRLPGRPAAVRVFTDAERQEAAQYAAEVGGEVVSLPLPRPAAYETGLDGTAGPSRTRQPASLGCILHVGQGAVTVNGAVAVRRTVVTEGRVIVRTARSVA